jgi:DNA-binding MarR family transcriptional regulator
MEEREMLEKMDQLRTRFNVSYARAKEVLEATDWDVIAATIRLEGEAREARPKGFYEELKVTGADLVETLKRLLHEGNINRLIVKDTQGREILNLPVNGALAVTLLIPIITAIGAVVVLAMDYTVLVERSQG